MNAVNARIAERRAGLVTWNSHDERAPPSAKFCLKRVSGAGGRRHRAQSAPRAWPMQLRPALPLCLAGPRLLPAHCTGPDPHASLPKPDSTPLRALHLLLPRFALMRYAHRNAPGRHAFRTGSAPLLRPLRGSLLPPQPHSPSLPPSPGGSAKRHEVSEHSRRPPGLALAPAPPPHPPPPRFGFTLTPRAKLGTVKCTGRTSDF